MNNNLRLLVFSLLSGAGGLYVGFHLGKKKYERLADIEVESVKKTLEEHYKKKESIPEISPPEKVEESNKPLDEEIEEYRDYSGRYSTEANRGDRIVGTPVTIEKKLTKEEVGHDGPYIISDRDYKESHYEAKTVYYFKDKIVADDDYNELIDVDDRIGDENLVRLSAAKDDYIYVRNDELEIDYEILIDERYFEQAAPRKTPVIED